MCVLVPDVCECGLGFLVRLPDGRLHRLDAGLLHLADLFIKIRQKDGIFAGEIFLAERFEHRLDVPDRKDVFKIVDQDQEQHVLSGILLLHGRREKIVLRVVVDHGLGQDLVLAVPLGGREMLVHKGRDLIHVQIDVGNLFRPDVIDVVETFKYAVQYIIRIYFHNITPMHLLYSIQNRMARKM